MDFRELISRHDPNARPSGWSRSAVLQQGGAAAVAGLGRAGPLSSRPASYRSRCHGGGSLPVASSCRGAFYIIGIWTAVFRAEAGFTLDAVAAVPLIDGVLDSEISEAHFTMILSRAPSLAAARTMPVRRRIVVTAVIGLAGALHCGLSGIRTAPRAPPPSQHWHKNRC